MTALQTLTFGGAGNITLSNSVFTAGGPVVKDGTGTLGLVMANSSTSMIFDDLAINDGTLAIKFTVAPSTNVPVIKVLGDLTFGGTAGISVTVDRALITAEVEYPLLTVNGSVPTSVPTLEGFAGGLKWGGPDNKTLLLTTVSAGTLIMIH